MINTHHGIQLPALMFSILETFGRDGLTRQHLTEESTAKYINNLILDICPPKHVQIQTNIGKGVGVQNEFSSGRDSNKDPFSGLMPAKSLV